MIETDLVALRAVDSPFTLSVVARAVGERWVPGGRSGTYYLEDVPSCRCCGDAAWPNGRCTKHQDRNPCAIDGCRKTTAAKGRHDTDVWLCSVHWRALVPPGSPQRRTYLRFFRTAKRYGWTTDLERRFWRFWGGLIKWARRRASGDLDQREIDKLFGWDG